MILTISGYKFWWQHRLLTTWTGLSLRKRQATSLFSTGSKVLKKMWSCWLRTRFKQKILRNKCGWCKGWQHRWLRRWRNRARFWATLSTFCSTLSRWKWEDRLMRYWMASWNRSWLRTWWRITTSNQSLRQNLCWRRKNRSLNFQLRRTWKRFLYSRNRA